MVDLTFCFVVIVLEDRCNVGPRTSMEASGYKDGTAIALVIIESVRQRRYLSLCAMRTSSELYCSACAGRFSRGHAKRRDLAEISLQKTGR